MRRQASPFGWCFLSADFSSQAMGKNCYGTVIFIRDDDQRLLWHDLSEEDKEKIPLYVEGNGVTIAEAIEEAEARIEEIGIIECKI